MPHEQEWKYTKTDDQEAAEAALEELRMRNPTAQLLNRPALMPNQKGVIYYIARRRGKIQFVEKFLPDK